MEERLCEDREGNWLSASREDSTETNLAGTLILDFQSKELWENKLLFLTQPVCDVLLWQPEHTNRNTKFF